MTATAQTATAQTATAQTATAQTTVRPTLPPSRRGLAHGLAPLAWDAGLPLVTYYVVGAGLGASQVAAFTAASAASLLRVAGQAVRGRRPGGVGLLLLAVNVAGLALCFLTGDVRLVAAKDAVLSSVVGLGILVSVVRGEPLMAAGLRPFITRGDAVREARWQQLTSTSAPFRRIVARHSTLWGLALLADCVVRLLAAAVAPVSVLGWIGSAATVAAIVLGVIVGGALTVDPLNRLLGQD